MNKIKMEIGSTISLHVILLAFLNLNTYESMKKNKLFGELYYRSLKKNLLTTRIVIILMILGVLQARANDTYSQKTLTEPSELQQKQITGTVIDEKGNPMGGVTVLVKGTTTGTLTDATGKYIIPNPPQNATLIFSFVGTVTQEIQVAGQTQIDIVLKDASIGLNEVVVVGYGTQKKVNLTGAVDVIKSDVLANRQASTASQLLQGLSPSTNLTISGQEGFQPGATMNITLRGIGSLNGGSPYVLVNGVAGDINNLNPDDIESISILKDAAASAIYGARAAYGVILVTTKQGLRNQQIHVTYQGTVSINTPPPLPKALDSYTWVRAQNEAGDNRGGEPFSHTQVDQIIAYQNQNWDALRPSFAPGQVYFGPMAASDNTWNSDISYANNDWWNLWYGKSTNFKHDLSFQGGTKNTSFYFSAASLQQSGYLKFGDDWFSRYNITGQLKIALAPWWDFSYEPRLAKKHRTQPSETSEGDYSFIFREISRIYPFVPVYDGSGTVYSWESHIPSVQGGGTNSLDELDTWNNFKTEIRPAKNWIINADLAYNYYQGVRSNIQQTIMEHLVDGTYRPAGVSVPNYLDRYHYNNTFWSSNIYSSYHLSINDTHNFSILGGTQFEHGNNTTLEGYKTSLILQSVPSINTAVGNAILNESLSHRALEGYFGRFNYNYKEKYLLEANARYDGSYVFRKGDRWGFFPSFSLGWNVDKEKFWAGIAPYVNTLKLRGSWGSLGNQNVSPYTDLELLPLQTGALNWIFGSGTTRPIGYTLAPGIVNKNLTWETATTKNIAVDMSFLKNRLTATAELYERLTTNMVGPQQALPGVLGASTPNANNATLRTRGWEVTLNWKQDFANGLSYYVSGNLSNYNSVVTKYFNPTGSLTTWYEGRTVGEIWGFTVKDLFRTQADLDAYLASEDLSAIAKNWKTGDLKYEDTNGDGKVDRGANTLADHGDQSIIGNDNPHFLWGLNAGASFKGFDFSMIWSGVAKKDIFFDAKSNIFWGSINGWWESCLQPRTLDYFRDTPGTAYSGIAVGDANLNTDAYFPRPYLNGTEENKNKNIPNTRYLQNGAYARLQTLQIGYSFPESIVSKLKIAKLRIAFSAENLFTITHLPAGIDPVAPVGYNLQGADYFGQTAGTGRLTYGADRIYSFMLTVTY
jgi:TonB-linked SusC/RagA family outer membrane protein